MLATSDDQTASILPPLTDPREPADPSWFQRLADGALLNMVTNPKDAIFTRNLAAIVCFVLPFTIALFLVPTWALIVMGPLYVAHVFKGYGGKIVLGLHAITHRPLFKKKYRWLDKSWTHVMPLFVGMPPFAYYAHHRMMHHNENVGDSDLSGTSEYQRDNIWHFLHYWTRFTFLGYYHMASWLFRRGHRKVAIRMIVQTVLGYSVVGVGLYLNPAATFFAFVLPYCMLRFFLMAGNWTEHAFVDVDNPINSYRNSTCLVNTPYNHNAYNAGYHLVHHIVPGLHWAAHPKWLEKNIDKLADQDSIVFSGVRNNQQIWFKLMKGDYAFLAEHLVDLGSRRPTLEEKIEFLKSRVQRQRSTIKGIFERREAAEGMPLMHAVK
ncbi:MAG: fatty acid desaturase [Kiritimatiellia bacterium]|jgi:fatty acid desaturase